VAGHTVSIFNRGKTADELPAQVERLRGDRDIGAAGLAGLKNRVWDVCVDVSGFTARQVRASAEELRNSVGHYVFVSAVSLYGEPKRGPVYESQPRLPPAAEDVTEVNGDTYGRLKVTCENIVQELYADRCAMLRPQIVAGPHDPIDRFSYWVRRTSQGGEMLAPGDGSDHVQFIDARDVARFTMLVCEKALQGSFNLAGPRLMWTKFMSVLGAQNIVWVPSSIIEGAGVTEFKLPLYRPTGSPKSNLMYVSNERAVKAGLTLTDTKDTADHVRSWLPNCTLRPALSRKREATLIRMAREGKVSTGGHR
jgi:2'-hydroxyisoflavone reductase